MRFAVVVVVAAVGASCVDAPPPNDVDAGFSPIVDVDACPALSEGGLVLDGVEGDADFDDEFAAVDLTTLPATLSLLPLSDFEAQLVRYLLDERDGDEFATDVVVAKGALGEVVAASFARGDAGGIDLPFLRRGLHRFYACARGFPLTLDAFYVEVADFRVDAVSQVVDPSAIKGLPRRIRRNAETGVFAAETLLPGDTVRETEIILTDRRNDGAIDFLEYGDDGKLRSASTFRSASGAESTGAVPFSCIACHKTHDVTPAGQP